MPAVEFDFTVEQGTDYNQVFIWKDDEGNPIDLTGYAAHFQVRARPDAPVLLDRSTTNDGIIIEGPEGAVYVVFDNSLLVDAVWKRGRYQLELTSPDGKKTRLASGTVSISPEIVK